MLTTTKCHFAYQSLLLLRQKVSCLGLSTHMEKVSAILNLDKPKNIHDLQIFLGMMVYFSSYIPFYAWIAAFLFSLLKKDTKWEWTDLHTEAFELCKQVLTNVQPKVMQFWGPHIGFILMLAISDLLQYFSKSRKFN